LIQPCVQLKLDCPQDSPTLVVKNGINYKLIGDFLRDLQLQPGEEVMFFQKTNTRAPVTAGLAGFIPPLLHLMVSDARIATIARDKHGKIYREDVTFDQLQHAAVEKGIISTDVDFCIADGAERRLRLNFTAEVKQVLLDEVVAHIAKLARGAERATSPENSLSGARPRYGEVDGRRFCWQLQVPSGQILRDEQVDFTELANTDVAAQVITSLIQKMDAGGFEVRTDASTVKWRCLAGSVSLAEVTTGDAVFLTLLLSGQAPRAETAAVAELFRIAEHATAQRRLPGAIASQRPLALTLACMPSTLAGDREKLGLLTHGTRCLAAAFFRKLGMV
jgi:hypothetical protein